MSKSETPAPAKYTLASCSEGNEWEMESDEASSPTQAQYDRADLYMVGRCKRSDLSTA